ncbi:glycogen synthase [Pseudoalteromonas ruthenica]|uniref:glycogen synthase n=1 Tax=Pseudoalteromonas ruthenica TaxID=151081 RepID=UPI0024201956|nr:glycogen/starch synthase [Pseudoalteromonas ruthenica]|tara:strand:- start:47480 stop:48997 length:1518 start_codon:yes stop_codon:yes gene_type:complete
MKSVLFVCAESSAIVGAKVGGVADVVGNVSKALAEQGTQVDVILPHYQCMELIEAQPCAEVQVHFAHQRLNIQLLLVSKRDGVSHYVLSHPWLCSEHVYHHDEDGRPFAADASKFALFCLAVAQAIEQGVLAANVLHLHDWHSATLAVLRAYGKDLQRLKAMHTVYTIHNLALQGVRPFAHDPSALESWFPWLSYDGQRICDPRYPHCYNPMRAAIELCDKVHVVSPQYMQEIQRPSNMEHGFTGGEGLENQLVAAQQQNRLVGILNGCDYQSESVNYTQKRLWQLAEQAVLQWMGKANQLSASHYIAHVRLQQWRANEVTPWLCSVGRISLQKVALLLDDDTLGELLRCLAEQGKHFMMLGSGDPALEALLTQAMAEHDNFLFLRGFALELGDAMYQLGSLFCMPSSFEPCGISQLLAMREGTPCLVHQVGGLKDTIAEGVNGFTFTGNSPKQQSRQLLTALQRALAVYHNEPAQWQTLCAQAKNTRFDWHQVAVSYLEQLYTH